MWDWFLATGFCPLCGRGSRGNQLCHRCREELARLREGVACPRCGRFYASKADYPLAPAGGAGQVAGARLRPAAPLCRECARRSWSFAEARAVFPYTGLIKEAIYRLKFAGEQAIGRPLASLMAEVLAQMRWPVDALVPVPLAPDKLAQRGFNQAEVLAREMGRLAGLPVEKALLRCRETFPQSKLSRHARACNIHGAFTLKGNPTFTSAGVSPPAGHKLLLVDDIFTTGSTAEEASRVLAEARVKVYVLTLAAGYTFF